MGLHGRSPNSATSATRESSSIRRSTRRRRQTSCSPRSRPAGCSRPASTSKPHGREPPRGRAPSGPPARPPPARRRLEPRSSSGSAGEPDGVARYGSADHRHGSAGARVLARAAGDLRREIGSARDESLRDQRGAANPNLRVARSCNDAADPVVANLRATQEDVAAKRPNIAGALPLYTLVDVLRKRLLLRQVQRRGGRSCGAGDDERNQYQCKLLHREPPVRLTQPTVEARCRHVVGGESRPWTTRVATASDLRWMPRRRRLVYRQRMQLAVPRSRRLPPRVADAALALALFTLGQAEVWTPFDTSLGHGSTAVAAVLGTLMTLPLAFRRTAPVVVGALVVVPKPIVAAFTPVRLLFFAGFLPLILMTYTLASRARTSQWLVAVALPFAGILAVELEVAEFRKTGEVVFDWLWLGLAAAVGLVVRARSLRAERSELRVSTLESEREAVLHEERARIARELHDVIAHSVSVIVVQAGAAEPLVDEDPEEALAALRSIRSTAGEALGEMRRLLGILRTAGDELSLDP